MTSISAHTLKSIVADQQRETIPPDCHARSMELLFDAIAKNNEIIVFTGMRRCGKSVLLHRLRNHNREKDYYFNFEDERLVLFTTQDFQSLYEIFLEVFGEQKTFYFDEIQNIPGWELFVRRLYNAGNKIYITGSNATLFSEELGTRLTGRYIKYNVYPFSFQEIVQYEIPELLTKKLLAIQDIGKIRQWFQNYCTYGGIPEYHRNHQEAYLHALYESIVYRDIIVRYKISNADALKKVLYFLASNCSKETTYSTLKKLLGFGSITTISDYCGYIEDSHLCFFLHRYSASVKTQQLSPKKVYFIDHVLAKIIGFRCSEDTGRMLKNIVFLELKRRGKKIYYHKNIKECDFVVHEAEQVIEAIQVTQSIADAKTRQREYEGLIEALIQYGLSEGLILTQADEADETITIEDRTYQITIRPLWKWLLKFT